MQPKASIITPLFNSAAFIEQTIKSVLAQTFKDWEMLIIDDASTDAGYDKVLAFAKNEPRIKPYRLEKNSGAGAARNLGIKNAKAKYITFLDADDLWKPEKLETQIRFMENSGAKISFSSYHLIDENGTSLHQNIEALPEVDFKKMLRSNYIGNLTAMYDAQFFGEVFMPTLRKRQDWAFWLTLVKKAGIAQGIPEVLADYRVRKNSISSNKVKMLKYNFAVYHQHLGFSKTKSALLMSRFLYEHFFVKPRQTIATK
ncbi:MAG: glycosyl transferase [Cytophagaceae bacterium]|nr:glycosyl transferase [Cytophagaceae bacterium]|tara:strand:- start:45874 stop:46644 length:771 start_codon:yes stop_codon:yes gene_type:complete